jgi:hypothetical protein
VIHFALQQREQKNIEANEISRIKKKISETVSFRGKQNPFFYSIWNVPGRTQNSRFPL